MPPKDDLSSAQDPSPVVPDECGFEEYIGPGFVSRGHYEDVMWPAGVCDACGRPLPAPDPVHEPGAIGAASNDPNARDEPPRPRHHRSDAGIDADLRDALESHPDIDAGGVELEVSRGEVALRGLVRDRAAHRLLIALALDTPGVVAVRDDLRLARIRAA
ncbi:MAG TPA: BON domain-containing protein [Nannocystis sp.]